MRLVLLVLIVTLATATTAAAQTGEPLDTITVGPNAEVVGSYPLAAGTTYKAVATGRLTKTFHNAGGVGNTSDAFYCFESSDPRFCQSQENPSEMIYAGTGDASPASTLGAAVEPDHKAPPYRSDHVYTVSIRFSAGGKLRVSTKPQCSVSGTSCSGPGYTIKLYSAEPTKCASGAANAFAALERVDFCYGTKTTIRAPAGDAAIITPEPTPAKADVADLFLALRELAFQEEFEELEAALAGHLDEEDKETLGYCIFFGSHLQLPDYERRVKAFKACVGLLEAHGNGSARARSAASRCRAVFVPVFPKGRKVTKRKLKRARAAARRQIAASCSARKGKLSISIRARGEKKLRAITGRRIQTAVTHRKPNAKADGPDRELTVRWRARKG